MKGAHNAMMRERNRLDPRFSQNKLVTCWCVRFSFCNVAMLSPKSLKIAIRPVNVVERATNPKSSGSNKRANKDVESTWMHKRMHWETKENMAPNATLRPSVLSGLLSKEYDFPFILIKAAHPQYHATGNPSHQK